MDLYNIITTVGIVAVLGAFIYIGRKLQTLDSLNKTSEKIKTNAPIYLTGLVFKRIRAWLSTRMVY